MKLFSKSLAIALTAGVIAAIPAQIAFADGHEATLKERVALKKQFGKNFGPLVAMAKGEKDYDADMAVAAVTKLKELAMSVEPLWIEGTDNVAMEGKTRALPIIWEEREEFDENLTKLIASADEAIGQVGNGVDALKPMIGKLGGSCQSCHKKYRGKKN